MQSTPQNISNIINKYIKIYNSEPVRKDETIYRLSNEDAFALGPDYIRPDKSRAFFSFYNMPAEQYDKEYQEFASATFYNIKKPDKNNKINLQLNVIIPVRDGVVDTALINELVSHELMHAYRAHNELNQGHKLNTLLDFAIKRFKSVKYTMTDRALAYDRIMPQNNGSDIDHFRWVAYSLVNEEMYANLAGIKGYLYETKNKKLKDSRFVQLTDFARQELDWIKQNATDEMWEYVIKKASYLPKYKNETLSHFKHRWIKYYENQLKRFDAQMEKIQNTNKNQQFTSAKTKLTKPHIIQKDLEY